jgi:hypothetical protein
MSSDEVKPPVSRLCPQCERPFEPSHGKRGWCSKQCYRAAYYSANQAGFIKQQAAYYAALRERAAQRKPALLAKLDQSAKRRIATRKAFLDKWSKLDWSKQNCELADETGFSRERIRQIRQQLDAPQPNHPGRQRVTTKVLQFAKNHLDKIKGMSWTEVEREFGLGPHWRKGYAHEFLKPFLRDGRLHKKHPWHLMNFRLPNSDLERIWRLPYNMVGAYRYHKRPSPRPWRFKPGTADLQFSGPDECQMYQRAVKAEERKAATHFAQA